MPIRKLSLTSLPSEQPDEHLPADRTAHQSWCLKCGRAITAVYKVGWRLTYPNPKCAKPPLPEKP
jgi:hypothetical protein